VARPDPALPLLHLLDRRAHRRLPVLAVRVAHLHAYVGREAEVMKRERGGGADADPLVLLLKVHRLPLGTIVLAGVRDGPAAGTDLFSPLRVTDQFATAVQA